MRVHNVDLSANTRLLAVRGLTAMWELTVANTALKMLPEWLGKVCRLEVLRVRGKGAKALQSGEGGGGGGGLSEMCGLKVLHVAGMGSGLQEGCPLLVLVGLLKMLTGLKKQNLESYEALTALPATL